MAEKPEEKSKGGSFILELDPELNKKVRLHMVQNDFTKKDEAVRDILSKYFESVTYIEVNDKT